MPRKKHQLSQLTPETHSSPLLYRGKTGGCRIYKRAISLLSAIQKAVETLDNCLRDTVEAAKAHGYEVIIIADHGNADHCLVICKIWFIRYVARTYLSEFGVQR